MREIINTDQAPAAIGPYVQAVKVGNQVFTSGQIPLDPASGEVVQGDVSEQTEQVMKNLFAVLTQAGATQHQVVKTTCFLVDMSDFAAFNAVYSKYFNEAFPARSCVAVAALPKGVKVEVEAIAIVE